MKLSMPVQVQLWSWLPQQVAYKPLLHSDTIRRDVVQSVDGGSVLDATLRGGVAERAGKCSECVYDMCSRCGQCSAAVLSTGACQPGAEAIHENQARVGGAAEEELVQLRQLQAETQQELHLERQKLLKSHNVPASHCPPWSCMGCVLWLCLTANMHITSPASQRRPVDALPHLCACHRC